MKHKNWLWGIFFLAAAAFVIIGQVGTFDQIGFWSVTATVLLGAMIVGSAISLNFFGIFISFSLLYMIYRQPLDLIDISFWLLVLASILASIGCSMIFRVPQRRFRSDRWRRRHGRYDDSPENVDGNDIFVKSKFSESCKYLHAESLKTAQLSSSFGKLTVYFDEARLSPEGAEVNVDVSFGEMCLYLSKNWRVVDKVYTSAGTVNNDTRSAPEAEAGGVLTLTGNVSFGNLEIHYV